MSVETAGAINGLTAAVLAAAVVYLRNDGEPLGRAGAQDEVEAAYEWALHGVVLSNEK